MRTTVVVLSVLAGVCADVGCGSEVTPNYGPAHGLNGTPANLVNPQQQVDAGNAGEDAAIVICDGGVPLCTVHWSADIFPKMMSTGAWKCANASCHGGVTPPRMTDDAMATYAALTSFNGTDSTGKYYIVPCNTDTTVSQIECSLSATGTCGHLMPLTANPPGATPLSPADLQLIDSWVKCGAPNN